jgi:uncharacterized protein (DUF58 family)
VVDVVTAPADRTRALVDPAALMKIRSLELRAKVAVEGLLRGLHRSPFHGFSVEFTEHRHYTPGDDVRFLDWRIYARTDRHYVKKFEDETNLRCQLLVDQSRSMAYASRGHSKADHAATLAATLAQFLFGQGDAVGVTTFDAAVSEHLPPRNRPGHLRRLLLALERPAAGRGSAVGAALEQAVEMLPRRGLIVLLSDLLVPASELERPLGALRAVGHEVAIFQVVDPVERGLSLEAPTVLRDLESGRTLHVDPASARPAYARAWEAHLETIRALAARLEVDHHLVGTDEPLDRTLLEFLGRRPRRTGRRP